MLRFPVIAALLAAMLVTPASVVHAADNAPGGIPGGGFPGQRVDPVDSRIILSHASFKKGKSYPLLLEVTIKDGYHTNSHTPASASLIPVVAEFSTETDGVTFGRIEYPPQEVKKFSFAKDPLNVYEGTIYIKTSLTFSEDVTGPVPITTTLRYQACTDVVCLMPGSDIQTAQLMVGDEGKRINKDIFATAATHHGENSSGTGAERFRSASGLGLFLLVFIGGLALNLTPCVYPIIPITIGYFGATTGKPKGEILLHAFTYLMGMAVMYSALGTFAAITGSLFGEMMQNTGVVLFLVGVMVLLSLSMFGFYEIKVPTALLKFSSRSYGGLFGTFFMGITVGIVAAPCVGPFVLGLLTFVSEKQDALLGFSLFFVLALGLGIPLVVLAVFSGALHSLPRSGVWMEWVRKFFGVVLLGMALYFAQPLMPAKWLGFTAILLLIAGAVYLFKAGSGIGGRVFQTFRTGIPVLMLLFAFGIFQVTGTEKPALHFHDYNPKELQAARADGRPQIVYFTADWCVPCRELKLFTYTDERVIALQGRITPLAVDVTKLDDKKELLKKEFGVKGVPTIIIYNAAGEEVQRFTGYIPAEKLLQAVEKAGL